MFKKLRQRIEEEENVPTVVPGKPIRLSVADSSSTSTGEDSGWNYSPSSTSASNEESPRKTSSKGWLGSSLSSMIRGDHQALLNDLGKEKEKLEAALEKQQDVMVQRMKEQEQTHQEKMAATAQELVACTQELERTCSEVADLELQVSTFQAERKESDALIARLKEECASLRSESEHLRAEVQELSRCGSTCATSTMTTDSHVNPAQRPDSDESCHSSSTSSTGGNRAAGDIRRSSGEPDTDSPKDGFIESEPPTPPSSQPAASRIAILDVRQRDVFWSEETSATQSLDEPMAMHQERLGISDSREPIHWAERVACLSEKNSTMAQELQEKTQFIKVQQQKITDLKRALQKGLKPLEPQLPAVPPAVAGATTAALPAPGTATAAATGGNASTTVNLQYLKHVVFKYMCSEGEEAHYLVKAIAVLLKFTPQEQRMVKEFQDYKISWFGSKPYAHKQS